MRPEKIRTHWSGSLLDHEKQKNRDEQGKNAQSFGKRDADEHTSELTIGRRWIAQRAQQELTKNYSNADCRCSRTDGGKTCAY
jgi:hypothetical protein